MDSRRLYHPHIIEFKEAFLTDLYICIVTEFAQGGDLFSFIRAQGTLTEPGARWFFQQVITALDYCHKRGVVVRDLKLENSLLHQLSADSLPILKLCDFGLSKGYSLGTVASDPKSHVG